MGEPAKVVAILASNPALSSIMSIVLAASQGLRVRTFDSQIALTTYMRLSPVDLLVCDFDSETAPAGALARALRFDETIMRREFQIIALTGAVTANIKQASIASGIDEVIVKPMSPKYLLERVQSRLKRTVPQVSGGRYHGPERRGRTTPRPTDDYAGWGDNVIPLFRDQRMPTL